MPSFQGINSDCSQIIKELRDHLKQQFRDKEVYTWMDSSSILTFIWITKDLPTNNGNIQL